MNTRSKTKSQLEAAATRQPENPQAQEEPQEDPSISVNWFFFDKSNVNNIDRLIKVPRSLFNKASQECCSLFATELLKAFKYAADESSIEFRTPKENTTQLEWKEGIDLKQSFKAIRPSQSFAKALGGQIADEDAVHLVVSALTSSISVNWFFFDKSNVNNINRLIKVPRSLFNGAAQECCSLFATELLKAFKYAADESSIEFWTPKEKTTRLKWKKGIDLEQSFEPVHSMRSFAKALAGRIDDEDAVHLVVSDSSIPVKWFFFDKSNVNNINRLIKVPRSLFNDASQECRSLFATELLKEFEYTATESSIEFWTPKEKTTRLKWKKGIDLEQSLEPVDLSQSFAKALGGQIADEDAVHLVVSALTSSIPVKWFFFDKSNVNNINRLIKVPRSLFNKASQECCSLFATELLKAFKYAADESSIEFRTPKENTTQPGWKEGIDFKQSFEPIDLSESFAKALAGRIDDEDAVHLVVTAEVSVDEQDETDMVPELKEFKRYKQTLSVKGPTPSQGAKSSEYREIQRKEETAIYDGRRAPDGFSTISPPLEIYHPVFSQFIHILNDPNVQPTADDLKNVQDLMDYLRPLFLKEDDYAPGLLLRLRKILQVDILTTLNPDGSVPDGSVTLVMGGAGIVYLVLELKREVGEGGSDPAHQVGLSSRRSWIHSSREHIREKCCCPTFLVAAAGPWIVILGEVFTDRFIVQRLTPMNWMSLSSTEEDSRVYHNARALIALRKCLAELQRYYQGLANIPRLVANESHPRYFPYPNSFTAADGSVTRFQYLCSLEDDKKCVTYLAELIGNSKKVVVKFVARYGEEVHKFLAQLGHAPNLLYCGSIPGNPLSGILSEPARQAPPGLCLRADVMHMVVMEYVNARSEKPQDGGRSQIEDILRLLHTNGYVFGDLREPNVLYGPDGIVQMIDFNWCGRYDLNVPDEHLPPTLKEDIDRNKEEIENKDSGDVSYVYYPLSMSKLEGMWAPGMEPLAPIRPQHDWAMLDKLLPKATYSQ